MAQVEGAIIFRVTDLQLAFEIDQLLKKRNPSVSQDSAKLKIHNGNGKAKKSPETKVRILNLLKERHSSSWFTVAGSEQIVKTAIGASLWKSWKRPRC